MVELVATVPTRNDQARVLQYVEMLGNGLTCRAEPVAHGQSGTQLEQRLTVPQQQLVEHRAPCRICKGLEHVAHVSSIGKSTLA